MADVSFFRLATSSRFRVVQGHFSHIREVSVVDHFRSNGDRACFRLYWRSSAPPCWSRCRRGDNCGGDPVQVILDAGDPLEPVLDRLAREVVDVVEWRRGEVGLRCGRCGMRGRGRHGARLAEAGLVVVQVLGRQSLVVELEFPLLLAAPSGGLTAGLAALLVSAVCLLPGAVPVSRGEANYAFTFVKC